jgi:hypothetical protein
MFQILGLLVAWQVSGYVIGPALMIMYALVVGG